MERLNKLFQPYNKQLYKLLSGNWKDCWNWKTPTQPLFQTLLPTIYSLVRTVVYIPNVQNVFVRARV
jgi:hypothetical protein